MQRTDACVVVLGTGGTIAGTSPDAANDAGYTAAQLNVECLVQAVPALAQMPLESEQVAQIDSKDMSFEVWRLLAERVAYHLARPKVTGVVVTHGTDTLEETAYLLQRVLAPAKPVVLTAAMRPATSMQADGPQNLLDAVRVARHPGARGVVAVMAGAVHSALDVRKAHTYRVDAFSSGDAAPIAWVEDGRLRVLRAWPQGDALGVEVLASQQWPRVEVVMSHAGASSLLIEALVAQGVQGLVVAGTGNGTVHDVLEQALVNAQAAGVQVMRCSRVAVGPVLPRPSERLTAGVMLSPVQARIELMLRILAAG